MKLRLIAASLLIASANVALADSNLYMAGSIGRSHLDIDQGATDANLKAADSPVTASSLDQKDMAFKLQLGYQFDTNWAVEAGYVDLGKANYAATRTTGAKVTADFEVTGWNITAVGMLPVNDEVSVIGKIGLFDGKIQTSASGAKVSLQESGKSRATYGIGVQYNLSKKVGVRAEYDHYTDFGNLLSAGVIGKF